MSTGIRSRWAAVGAAVAVTLGAGGIGLVSATSPAGAVAYVPIEPCRAADTRPGDDNVGPRSNPIGAGETHTVSSNDGDCSGDIPGSATGLQLNVTAVGATLPSFLTIWASGDRPLASSLNPTPGEPPVPNAVTTGITAAGNFNIFNNAGAVDVVVDIVGYHADHHHDDRYYTETEADVAFLSATAPIVLFHSTSALLDIGNEDTVDSLGSGAFLKGGFANLGITGPVSVAGVGYRLESIEYCVRGFSGSAFIAVVNIWREGPQPPTVITDTTDRSTPGCYTVAGETGPPAFGYDVQFFVQGSGSLIISGLRSTWIPAP